MNAEQRIAMQIGQLVIQNEAKSDQIVAMSKQIEELTSELEALKDKTAAGTPPVRD